MYKLIHRIKSEVQHMHKYLSTRHIGKRVKKNNLRHLTNLYTNSRNYINLLNLALHYQKTKTLDYYLATSNHEKYGKSEVHSNAQRCWCQSHAPESMEFAEFKLWFHECWVINHYALPLKKAVVFGYDTGTATRIWAAHVKAQHQSI